MRRLLLAACAGVAVLVVPATVTAQPEVFFQRLADLTTALEGTYGDEGPRIGEALDQMSSALAEWDRSIQAFETRLASESSSQSTIGALVSLARMHAQRGKSDDALRTIERALRLDPKRADVYLLRGLLLDAAGKPVEAAEAFAKTWALDASDPINAYYYLLRRPTITATRGDAQAARGVLSATARMLLTAKTRPPTPRFPDLRLVDRSASDTPLMPLAAYAPAYARLARGDYDGAITAFRSAAAVDPIVVDSSARPPTMVQAIDALREGRLNEARARLENVNELRESSETHRLLGLIYWAGSDDAKSVEQLTAAVRRNPRDERSRLALFQVLRLAERDDDAAETLQDAIRVLPESMRARWWLGVTYERLNRFLDARRTFEQAASGAVIGRSPIDAAIGRLAMRQGDLSAAAEAFARSIDANPNERDSHKYLAWVLQQQDRPDDALVEWVAALMIDPLDTDAHAGLGQLLVDIGRHSDAVAYLRRAVDLSPDHTEARYALAAALARVGNTVEADREFERVAREQRQAVTERRRTMTFDVLKEEARARASDGDYERAAALWRQVIDRQPAADPVVYRELAEAYRRLGRAEDAAQAAAMYQKALQSLNQGGAR